MYKMEVFNKIWKCVELRESLQTRRISQIEKLTNIVRETSFSECPEKTSQFYSSYLLTSLEIAKNTVGALDCEITEKNLEKMDGILARIERLMPICTLSSVEIRDLFNNENQT